MVSSDPKPSQSGKSGFGLNDPKSSSVAKPDSKAGTPQSNKGEVKSAGKCALSAGVPGAAAVPEPSPKRTKRTRNNMSVSNSPVTPSDGIAYKRRR